MKWVKIISIALLTTAFVASMSVIMPSGSKYCYENSCGVYFWGAHEHDSVWHLAVISNLLNHFPFEMPNMSKTPIAGYNYLMDIVIAVLVFISKIDGSIWYFKILPVLWFGMISYLSFKFATSYRKSKTYPIFVWLFLFFGSSFSYFIKWYQTGNIWGGSSVISMQALQNMLNPQFAWSLIPLFMLLIGFNRSKRTTLDYLLYGVYSAIAIGLKFYTGMAMLAIIAFDLLITMMADKKKLLPVIINGFIVVALAGLSICIFYNPGSSTGFPFIWKPWETINPIIEDNNLFYLPTWAERLYAYKGMKLIGIEILVLIIFTVFNFGTRFIALFGNMISDKNTMERSKRLVIFGSVITALLSIMLTQRGVWWNTVQFLYVSLFLTGLLAAEGLDKIWQIKNNWGKIGVIGLIVLTIPNNLDIFRLFSSSPGSSYIKADEIEALQRLGKEKDGVILTPLFLSQARNVDEAELPNKYDTAYISAYSGKQTYLTDLIQLKLSNVEYQDRIHAISRFDCEILRQVDYVYEYKNNQYVKGFNYCGISLHAIIENDAVSIYQINK